MACVSSHNSIVSMHGGYNSSRETFLHSTAENFVNIVVGMKKSFCGRMSTINATSLNIYTDFDIKKQLWMELFPGEEMIQPYDGAVEEFEGYLGKKLSHDVNIGEYLDP